MKTLAIVVVILAVGALGKRGHGKFDADEFVSEITPLVEGKLDECTTSSVDGILRRLLSKTRKPREDSEEDKPTEEDKFADLFTTVFGEDYCTDLAGMDSGAVAQLLADRLFVVKFAQKSTKFVEQIRTDNCEAVEESLPVEESASDSPTKSPTTTTRRFLRKGGNKNRQKMVSEEFMTVFEAFFSEGYCGEESSEELAMELGEAVLAGDVVFEGRGDGKDNSEESEETKETEEDEEEEEVVTEEEQVEAPVAPLRRKH